VYGAYEHKASVRGCGNAFEGEAIEFLIRFCGCDSQRLWLYKRIRAFQVIGREN